jgi:hypothetical protein
MRAGNNGRQDFASPALLVPDWTGGDRLLDLTDSPRARRGSPQQGRARERGREAPSGMDRWWFGRHGGRGGTQNNVMRRMWKDGKMGAVCAVVGGRLRVLKELAGGGWRVLLRLWARMRTGGGDGASNRGEANGT